MTLVVALLVAGLLPDMALAHGGLAGGGGFYSGASHPVLAIEQFLALLAYGLLLGQQPGAFGRAPLVVLALGLGIGLMVGSGVAGLTLAGLTLATLALALALGGMLAAAVELPVWVTGGIGGLTGFVIGADTDVPGAPSADLVELAAPYAGVLVGVFLIVLNAAALASVARKPPFPIGLRIAGSWIAAIALMVLALRVRGLVAI